MNEALSLIREFEGFRETPYWDVNAFRTGYGSDTITLADGRVVPVRQGMAVTREDAERDLLRRVNGEFAPRAASAVGAGWERLSPAQQAALVSITYNYGSLPSSVARAAATGDVAATEAAIRALSGHNDGVNRGRRNREADIFAGMAALPDVGNIGPGIMPMTNPTASVAPAVERPTFQNILAAMPQLQQTPNVLAAAPMQVATNALRDPLRMFRGQA
jgi:GH24 family phage-related lysozyme (muramidase)